MNIADELTLRKLLWLRHSAEHFSILYGDDGEMQCGACLIDFRRDSPDDIEKRFEEIGLRKLHAQEATRKYVPLGRCGLFNCPACCGS